MNVCTYPNGVFAIRCDQTSNCPRTVSATQNIYFHGNSHFCSIQFPRSEILLNKAVFKFVRLLSVCVRVDEPFCPNTRKINSPKKANGVWERARARLISLQMFFPFEYGKMLVPITLSFTNFTKKHSSPEIKTTENPCYFCFISRPKCDFLL